MFMLQLEKIPVCRKFFFLECNQQGNIRKRKTTLVLFYKGKIMHLVSNYGMIISGAILLVAYIFIASEKIQKSVVALVGASLTMLLGLLPFHGYVNPET